MGDRRDKSGDERTLDAVFLFVSSRAGVGRHFIRSGSRVASVVYARALAGLLLERLGWTKRASAAALGMDSHSSLVELLKSYRDRRDIGGDLAWAERTLLVGNLEVAESGGGCVG